VWFLETALALHGKGCEVDIVAQPGSALLERASKAGLPTVAIPIRFDGAPWTVIKLRRHFLRRGTQAILANMTKDLKAAGVAGRWADVPVILGTRESDFPLKSKAYYRWYYRKLATGLLVNSRATLRTVMESAPWLDPDRVHLLTKGIDIERFRPQVLPSEPVVGFAGQLIPRKGLTCLMEAWRSVEGADAPPRLRLAGEGAMRPAIEAWRGTLKHPDRVELVGLVEDMPTFYAGLSLLVLPSRAEGFGLVAAEASACGRPVVATDTSSLPEIVVDGETGRLVPVDDAAALAAAINGILADPAKAAMGQRGRDRIVNLYNRKDTLQRLRQLLGIPDSSE
jgi:glycosyltransferase involved in cell wall biosynthesis